MKQIYARIGILIYLVASSAAMVLYTGGNPISPQYSRYAFFKNFLSDLGIRQGYNHSHTLPIVNILFEIALIGAVIAFVACFIQNTNKIINIVTILAAGSILLIGIIPADLYFLPHRIAFLSALLFITTACTLTVSLKSTKKLSLFTFFLYGYLLWIFLAPQPGSSDMARLIHVGLQKVAVYGLLVALY